MKRSWTIKIIKRIYGVYQWGRYWANIASRSYTKNISIEGNLSSLGENVCIFSLVSRKGRILRSTFYLIEAIKKQGYSLIIVANGQKVARDWLEGAIASCDLIINRPNLGRDFAAYQLATNLLLGGRHPIRRLLYCNDSVFYLDKNDPQQIFQQLITSDDLWIGMTENYYKTYHVSSWCFQVTHTVLNAEAFVKFWKIYRPVNSRRHAINRGELVLSRVLLQAGFIPKVVFNANSLVKNILQKQNVSNPKLILQQIHNLSPAETPDSELKATLRSVFLGEETNQTNDLAILLISEIGFPFLKKGLAFQAEWPISVVVTILEEFMSGFSAESANEIRLRGIRRSLTIWQRLLLDAGII